MGINISFRHPDTNVEMSISVEKLMTFIYGGNGTGKTTLSRQFDTNKHKVFNTDFVNKNVFIISDTGAKCDSSNKTNFSQLFLGEEAVSLAKEVVDLKDKMKTIVKKTDETNKEINQLLVKNGLRVITDFKELLKGIEYELDFDISKAESDLRDEFVLKNKLTTVIKDDSEYEKSLKLFKEFNISVQVRKTIEEDLLLSKIFVTEDFDYLKESISKYIDFSNELNDLELSFSKHGKTSDVKKWVKEGIDLHKDKSDCIFCENRNIDLKIADWRSNLENKKLILKTSLLKDIDELIKSLKKIVDNKSLYELATEKIVASTSNLKGIFESYKKAILSNKKFVIQEYKIEKDDIWKEQETLIDELRNYLINKYLEDIMFAKVYVDEFDSGLKKKIEDSKLKNKSYADKTASAINRISTRLGFEKEMLIEMSNRGNMPKISLAADAKTRNLANYSEGQRHKLALSIFFANIIESNEKYDVLVLDDPVISLDVFAYHAVKVMLKDSSLMTKCKRLLILTHNIHYLYVQMSNILDSTELIEITDLYEITPYGIDEVSIEMMKYDDLLIFTSLYNEIRDKNDLSTVYWLSSKIARVFLDLKLRMLGIESKGNPSDEVSSLNPVDYNIEKLKKGYSDLAGLCKTDDATVEIAIQALTLLNELIIELKLPSLINLEVLEMFIDYRAESLDTIPAYKNLKQEIAVFAKKINFPDEVTPQIEELQNYINHPRHQITESIFGIRSSIDNS